MGTVVADLFCPYTLGILHCFFLHPPAMNAQGASWELKGKGRGGGDIIDALLSTPIKNITYEQDSYGLAELLLIHHCLEITTAGLMYSY